jgi:hypothetical protein
LPNYGTPIRDPYISDYFFGTLITHAAGNSLTVIMLVISMIQFAFYALAVTATRFTILLSTRFRFALRAAVGVASVAADANREGGLTPSALLLS